MIFRTVTVFSIMITICIGENVMFPEKYKHLGPGQAIASGNRHQFEVPSSYKSSVLHLYTSPRSIDTANLNEYSSHPTNLQIQYAPLMKPGEVRLHKGKYTKLSPSNYLNNGLLDSIKVNFGDTVTTEHPITQKKPLEPRIEPENLYTHKNDHPQPLKHIDYVPGHNIEVMRSVDRYPGHNAIYNNSPNEKQNRVNSQYVIYAKPREPEPRKNDRFFQWNSDTTRSTSLGPPQSTTITTTRRPFSFSSPPLVMQNARLNQYYIGKPIPYVPPLLPPLNQNSQAKQARTIKITKMHSILLNVARNYNQGLPTLDTRKNQLSRLLFEAPGANTKLYPVQMNNLRYAYNYK